MASKPNAGIPGAADPVKPARIPWGSVRMAWLLGEEPGRWGRLPAHIRRLHDPVVHAAATMPPRMVNRWIIGNLTPENRFFSVVSGQAQAGSARLERKSACPSSCLPDSDVGTGDR